MVKAKPGGLNKYIVSFLYVHVFQSSRGDGRKEKGESGDQKALILPSPIWTLVVKSN